MILVVQQLLWVKKHQLMSA